MNQILRLIRVKQWIKNVFVFLPAFFAGEITEISVCWRLIIAFLLFCAASSTIYCINDVKDAKLDRLHPVKCKRPVASGAISKHTALVISMLLALIAIAGTFALPVKAALPVLAVLVGYLLMNLAYTFYLKNIPILDVFIIALGFVFRLMVGSFATIVVLSPWIVIMTFLLAMFLGMAKRRHDLLMQLDGEKCVRNSVRGYNLTFVNMVLCLLAAITMVGYIMYTLSPDVVLRFGSEYVYATSLFVLGGILRYLYLVIGEDDGGSPTNIVLHDNGIRLCVIGWLAMCFLLLYF